jgi:hypothetical protein
MHMTSPLKVTPKTRDQIVDVDKRHENITASAYKLQIKAEEGRR